MLMARTLLSRSSVLLPARPASSGLGPTALFATNACRDPPSSKVLPFCRLYLTRDASAFSQRTRARYLSSSGSRQSATKVTGKSSGNATGSGATSSRASPSSFLQRWMAPKEMPQRGTLRWYGEMVLICTVFAITGSSTMVLVRPAVSNVLGLQGSLKDGPWSYRICSLVIMTPLYATLLVMVGTVFGRHAYFRHFSVKMFSRFGIPPELMDKTFHETSKNFRKW